MKALISVLILIGEIVGVVVALMTPYWLGGILDSWLYQTFPPHHWLDLWFRGVGWLILLFFFLVFLLATWFEWEIWQKMAKTFIRLLKFNYRKAASLEKKIIYSKKFREAKEELEKVQAKENDPT